MRDDYGRTIDYLRISLTDRCNLRCVYCMPEDGVEKLTHCDILSYEEIVRIVRVLAGMGLAKIKLTGGEPLVRLGAADFVAQLKEIPGIQNVTMTSNGILLPACAEQLRENGLDGVNISLDTMDPARYRAITRHGVLQDALAGLDAALAAGIPSVKVNCVVAEGLNEQDVLDVAALARDRAIQVRFIEMMPLGLGHAYTAVDNSTVRRQLETAFGPMTPWSKPMGNGPAVYHALDGFEGKIGFISAVGSCFCASCNRVRLTADGFLKPCLHAETGVYLKTILQKEDDALLRTALIEAIKTKPEAHRFFQAGGGEQRMMSQIGG